MIDSADVRIGLGLRAGGLFFFALGGKATAKGEEGAALPRESRLADVDRCVGDGGVGDSGELGEGDVDFEVISRKAAPLEGDLESERRNCLIAEVASTCCM